MKYFITALIAVMLISPMAEARWYGHHRRHGDCCYAADIATGIIGTTAGVMIANELMNHPRRKHHAERVYIYEPETKCYTVVSRKTGKVTQECVSSSENEVIYVD